MSTALAINHLILYALLESDKQKEYRKFFKSVLKKYGVSAPNQLDKKKQKEFWNYVENTWKKGKNE